MLHRCRQLLFGFSSLEVIWALAFSGLLLMSPAAHAYQCYVYLDERLPCEKRQPWGAMIYDPDLVELHVKTGRIHASLDPYSACTRFSARGGHEYRTFLFSSAELASPGEFLRYFMDREPWSDAQLYLSWSAILHVFEDPRAASQLYAERRRIMVPRHFGPQLEVFNPSDHVRLDTYLQSLGLGASLPDLLAGSPIQRAISLQGGGAIFFGRSEQHQITRLILGYLEDVAKFHQLAPASAFVAAVHGHASFWHLLPGLFRRQIDWDAGRQLTGMEAEADIARLQRQMDADLVRGFLQGLLGHGSPVPRPRAPRPAEEPPEVGPDGLMRWQPVPLPAARRRPSVCPSCASSLWGLSDHWRH